jgi:hypothetical protein
MHTSAEFMINRALKVAAARRAELTFGGLQDVDLWLRVATVYAIMGNVRDSRTALRKAIQSTETTAEFSGEIVVRFQADVAIVQAINERDTSGLEFIDDKDIPGHGGNPF